MVELFPPEQRNVVSDMRLELGIAVGPMQQILRPAKIEDAELVEMMEKEGRFGEHRIFERSQGLEDRLEGGSLVLRQERGPSVRLTEEGSILVRLPLRNTSDARMGGMDAIIQETVEERLRLALGYADWLLQHVDPSQRATHIAVGTRLVHTSYRPWRTLAEHQASPQVMSVDMHNEAKSEPVHLVKPRAALRVERARLIEDLIVPMRRKFQRG